VPFPYLCCHKVPGLARVLGRLRWPQDHHVSSIWVVAPHEQPPLADLNKPCVADSLETHDEMLAGTRTGVLQRQNMVTTQARSLRTCHLTVAEANSIGDGLLSAGGAGRYTGANVYNGALPNMSVQAIKVGPRADASARLRTRPCAPYGLELVNAVM